MRIARQDSTRDAGWTLIELLVGLVLLSLIMVLLTNSVFSSRRAIDQLQLRRGDVSVEVVETYLRHALSEAQPIKQVHAAIDAPLIGASHDRLQLISAYAPAGQYGGLYQIDLELSPAGNGRGYDLAETRTLYRPEAEPGASEPDRPSTRSRLLRNVRGLGFRYYGVRGEEEPPAWSDDWTDPTKLPELIEIQVGFSGSDDRKWLPFVVALAVGQ